MHLWNIKRKKRERKNIKHMNQRHTAGDKRISDWPKTIITTHKCLTPTFFLVCFSFSYFFFEASTPRGLLVEVCENTISVCVAVSGAFSGKFAWKLQR